MRLHSRNSSPTAKKRSATLRIGSFATCLLLSLLSASAACTARQAAIPATPGVLYPPPPRPVLESPSAPDEDHVCLSPADMAAYQAYVEALERWVDEHRQVLETPTDGAK